MRIKFLGILLLLMFLVVASGNSETIDISVQSEEDPGNISMGKISTETGWVKMNGIYYYVLQTGEYTKDQMIDNYYLDSNGAMVTDQWVETERGKNTFLMMVKCVRYVFKK